GNVTPKAARLIKFLFFCCIFGLMLDEKIRQYAEEIERFTPKSADEVEAFRLKFLVAKGVVRSLFEEFKSVPADQKRVLGKTLNEFKQLAEHKFSSMQAQFESASAASKSPSDDLTLPGEGFVVGSRHPLSLVRKEIVEIRSEEHTSELQSRENLVCRLL